MSKTTKTGEITVQYLNEKKEGKKFASIKSSEGDYYGCLPAMLREFRQGEVCKIEFTEEESSRGIWRQITKKIGGGPVPQPFVPQIRARANPVDSEQIFTTALLKEFISAGKIGLLTTEIADAINIIRSAYKVTFAANEKQRNETDINDEVPY